MILGLLKASVYSVLENDESLLVHANGTITVLHLNQEKQLVFKNRNGEFEIDDTIFSEVFPGFDQCKSEFHHI